MATVGVMGGGLSRVALTTGDQPVLGAPSGAVGGSTPTTSKEALVAIWERRSRKWAVGCPPPNGGSLGLAGHVRAGSPSASGPPSWRGGAGQESERGCLTLALE